MSPVNGYIPLYSAEASLCCREAGEKEGRLGRKKKMARGGEGGTIRVSPRAFYFSIIAIFTVISSGSLCGGERVYPARLI